MTTISSVRRLSAIQNRTSMSARSRMRARNVQCYSCHSTIPDSEESTVTDWKSEYDFIQEIGRGHFAKVWHVQCTQNAPPTSNMAAKLIRRRRGGVDMIASIQREVAILKAMQSAPNIVKLITVHETRLEMGLILEYALGGCLWKVCQEQMSGLPESYVQQVILQVLSAIQALHANSIVHLDIKADNILLRSPYPDCNIALCDFGLAVFLDETKVQRELVGTPDYVAPEIINFDQISTGTDMWSVGVTTYYLLTGVSPFMGPTKEETFINISEMSINYPEDLFAAISPAALDFMQALIIKKPSERASAATIAQHDWLKSARSSSRAILSSTESSDSGIEDFPVDENHRSSLTNTSSIAAESLMTSPVVMRTRVLTRQHSGRSDNSDTTVTAVVVSSDPDTTVTAVVVSSDLKQMDINSDLNISPSVTKDRLAVDLL